MYFVKSTLFFIKIVAQNFVGSKKNRTFARYSVLLSLNTFFVTFYVGLKMGFGTKFVKRF